MLFIKGMCVLYVLYVYMCVPSFPQTRHCSGSPSKAFQQSRQDLFLSFPAFILQPSLEETAYTRVRLLDLPCHHCTDIPPTNLTKLSYLGQTAWFQKKGRPACKLCIHDDLFMNNEIININNTTIFPLDIKITFMRRINQSKSY